MNQKEKKQCCNFCGAKETALMPLFKGAEANVCQSCAEIAYLELMSPQEKETVGHKLPYQIKDYLDQHVIGQEEAKKTLSVAVYNHYKRISCGQETNIKKSNILLCGPTGSGKTYIVETLAKLLDVPFVIGDATTLTEAGYVGADIESLIERLYVLSGENIEKTEKGIIYIDEIDKISTESRDSGNNSVGRKSVQENLLKMVEGTDVEINIGLNSRKNKIKISTKNILFIVGGAFVGIRKKESHVRSLGFIKRELDPKREESQELTSDDFTSYGMIPEFVGRFPIIVELNELKLNELKDILHKPKDAILKQYAFLFKIDGIDVQFNDETVQYIAQIAVKKNLGARGLKGVIEKQMLSLMYEMPKLLEQRKGEKAKLIITPQLLRGEEDWKASIEWKG